MKISVKLIMILVLFNLNYAHVFCNDGSLPRGAIKELETYELEKLKEKAQVDKNFLLQGILERDLTKVKQHINRKNLNEELCIQLYGQDLKKRWDILKKHVTFTDAENKYISSNTGEYFGYTYLSIAILNSNDDKNKLEKENSLEVIKELLEKKADPNATILRAKFIKDKNNPKVSLPFEAFPTLPFLAIGMNCRPEILNLLFDHGVCPHETNCEGIDFIECAQMCNAVELISVIKSRLYR